MGTGHLGRQADLLKGGIGARQRQVGQHRAVEQQAVLGHHADLGPQGVEIHLADVIAIEADPALKRVVEPGEQLEQGALAAATAANDADEGTGWDFEAHIHQLQGPLVAKAEVHALVADAPLQRRQGRQLLAGDFDLLGLVDDVGEPLQGQGGFLEVLPEGGQAQQGAGDKAGQDAEGDQLAQGHFALEHQPRPHPQHQQAGELLEKLAGRAGGGAGEGVAEAGLNLAAVELLPAPAAVQLHPLALHRFHAAEGFHQVALYPGIGLGLVAQLGADDRRRGRREPHEKWHHRQAPEGEADAVEQHHGDVDQGKHRVQHHRQRRAGEKAADLFQLVDAAAHLPHWPAGEIAQGQAQQVVDDRGAEGDVDPVGGVGEQIGAQGAQHRLGHGHAHQQGAEHIEAAEVALADHRIDDLLDQQRIEQPKQLHKEAGDQHLDQNPAVLLERR